MKALSNDLLTVRTFDELMPDDRNAENRLANADERDQYAERGGVFGSEADTGDEPDTRDTIRARYAAFEAARRDDTDKEEAA